MRGKVGVIVFNLSQTNAQSVTVSGVNAPTGTVAISQVTSDKITDNNESSDVVKTTNETLSGFSSTTTLSLPPFSMTVLTAEAAATTTVVAAPSFSLPSGSYKLAQKVTVTEKTSGAAIHYTTDGSTPTARSAAYTEPILVSASETLHAVAYVSGKLSTVSSESYKIALPQTGQPVFSVKPGYLYCRPKK